MRRLGVLLVLALTPGCVALFEEPAADAPTPGPAPRAAEDAPATLALAPAPGPAAPALPASLSFAELWLWPVQDQLARLDAPGATRVEWFVGIEGVHPDVRFVHARPYVTAAPGKAREHPVDVGPLAPGAAGSLRLHEAGRHVFALASRPEATLVLTVLPEAPGEATAFLVEEDGRPRFVPERLAARPGARVSVLNEASAPLALNRTAFLPWVASGGAALDFTPVDEGMYVVVAQVADDAGLRGEARGRFLVDYDRPPRSRDVGPVRGSFLGAPGEEPHAFAFEAELPVAALRLEGSADSLLPGDAAVRLRLERDGEALAETTLTPEGAALALADLPSGKYQVRLLPEAGQMVSWRVEGNLTYRLPVPARLREG